MKAQYKEIEEKMNKTLDALYREFGTIRAGKASPSVLDRVTVDYYGAATPIQQLATISTPDPRTLMIQPWDKSTLKLINKAIQASDVGINPTDDGSVIRLVFPAPTEERRKELYKEQKLSKTVVKGPKVGRNDPCPCGSGKKYKKCCGRDL